MKALYLALMFGVLLVFVLDVSAVVNNTFIDEFEIDHDYFADGVAGTLWDGFIVNGGNGVNNDTIVSDVLATEGKLLMATSFGNWFGAEDDGAFLYKTVASGADFIANIYISDYTWVDYHEVGIMARSTESTSQDYVFLRYFQKWIGNGVISTTQGESDVINNGTPDSPMPYLRLQKSGSVFKFSASYDGIDFVDLGTIERYDLADVELQVGIFQSTYTQNTGVASIDFFKLDTLHILCHMPFDGEKNVVRDKDLCWCFVGDDIEMFDLYFGDMPEPELIFDSKYKVLSQEPVSTVMYDPGLLECLTTYYWRIDYYVPDTSGSVVNDYVKIEGDTYSFTTEDGCWSICGIFPQRQTVDGSGINYAEFFCECINARTYQWYRASDNSPLAEGSKYSNVTSSVLKINNVSVEDEDYYYCIGKSYSSTFMSGFGQLIVGRIISYYDMESIAYRNNIPVIEDSVGGYDIILQPGVVDGTYASIAEGIAGEGSLMFDKTSGHFAFIGGEAVAYNDITIVLWVKRISSGIWERILGFGTGYSGGPYMYITASDGNSVRFAISGGDGSDEQIVEAAEACAIDEWTYIAVTLEDVTARVYVNGEMQGKNATASYDPVFMDFYYNLVAGDQYEDDLFFGGAIDELKIYNYALNSEEIANDFLSYGTEPWVCNYEGAMSISYDLDGDCEVTLVEFSYIAAEWLNSNRVYAGE